MACRRGGCLHTAPDHTDLDSVQLIKATVLQCSTTDIIFLSTTYLVVAVLPAAGTVLIAHH